MKHLVKLPPHDPARVSLEVLIQLTSTVTPDSTPAQPSSLLHTKVAQLKQELALLDRYTAADEETRRKLGLDHYSPRFLATLSNPSWRISAIIEQLLASEQ